MIDILLQYHKLKDLLDRSPNSTIDGYIKSLMGVIIQQSFIVEVLLPSSALKY